MTAQNWSDVFKVVLFLRPLNIENTILVLLGNSLYSEVVLIVRWSESEGPLYRNGQYFAQKNIGMNSKLLGHYILCPLAHLIG